MLRGFFYTLKKRRLLHKCNNLLVVTYFIKILSLDKSDPAELFVKLYQLLQMLITSLCSILRLLEQSLSSLWEWLDQTSVTSLVVQECLIIIEVYTLLRCEAEWILALCLNSRVE